MGCLDRLLGLLNNGSVAAFLGAALAFTLVVANDWRRKRLRRKAFTQLLAGSVQGATRRMEAVTKTRDLLKSEDRLHPGEFQKFPVPELNALKLEVYDSFSAAQRTALESLLFLMQATNNLLDLVNRNSERLYELYIEKNIGDESQRIKRKVLIDLHAVISNLGSVNRLGSLYLAGRYKEMDAWRYVPARAEDIVAGRDT